MINRRFLSVSSNVLLKWNKKDTLIKSKPEKKKDVIKFVQDMSAMFPQAIEPKIYIEYTENSSGERVVAQRDISSLHHHPGPKCGDKYTVKITDLATLRSLDKGVFEHSGPLLEKTYNMQCYFTKLNSKLGLLSFCLYSNIIHKN